MLTTCEDELDLDCVRRGIERKLRDEDSNEVLSAASIVTESLLKGTVYARVVATREIVEVRGSLRFHVQLSSPGAVLERKEGSRRIQRSATRGFISKSCFFAAGQSTGCLFGSSECDSCREARTARSDL